MSTNGHSPRNTLSLPATAAKAPDFDNLVQAIYESALDPDSWSQTLEKIRAHLNASAINLIALDVAAFDNPFLYTSNIPADYGKEYQAHWFKQDPWVKAAARQNLGIGGKTLMGNLLVDPRELRRSEFYNDWLADQDIKDVLATNLWEQDARQQDEPRIVLCFFRNQTAEDFQRSDQEKLQRLANHLNRAFRIAGRLGLLERGTALQQSVVDGLAQAVFMLDERKAIVQANPAAQRLLDARSSLVKLNNGHVSALGQRTNPDLDTAFTLADRGKSAQIAFHHPSPSGSLETGQARLVRLNEIQVFGLPQPNIRYLLMIEPANPISEDALKSFCGLFKLSRAEQCVLRELMNDATPDEIAQSQEVSLNTIRTHLKNIRQKTGVHRMTELVRMAFAATRAP